MSTVRGRKKSWRNVRANSLLQWQPTMESLEDRLCPSTFLNFDEMSDGVFLGEAFSGLGVVFDNAIVRSLPEYAVSPPNVIISQDESPLSIRFPSGAVRVGIHIDRDGYSSERQPQMRVYDAADALLGLRNFGQGPDFVNFEFPDVLVSRVLLGAVPRDRPDEFYSSDSFDDMIFEVRETLTATGTELTATAGQRFAAVVSSFSDCGSSPGTATDYVAYLDWGDGTALGTGGVERTGPNTFDVAGSHRYATAGEFWMTIYVYDARTGDRSAVAYTYVNVVPADSPGPGGGWDADLLAALDAIHGDPWKERQSDYAAFELLPL